MNFCLFNYIWVKRHFSLIDLCIDFNIIIHNLCSKWKNVSADKNDEKSAKTFAKDSKLLRIQLIYTERSKRPCIGSCETHARNDDQVVD